MSVLCQDKAGMIGCKPDVRIREVISGSDSPNSRIIALLA